LLTARENEVLALIKDGLSNKDIAARLEISVGAVANVVSVVYHKLGVKDRAGAVEVARRQTAIRGATL
jgi:DNA-binding NarL/FixJ family response regulator